MVRGIPSLEKKEAELKDHTTRVDMYIYIGIKATFLA